MRREIFELDDMLLIEIQQVAKQYGKTLDEAVGDALRQWVDTNRKPNRLPFIGMFDGPGTSADQVELDRVLREGIDPYEGWSPDRPDRQPSQRSEATT